MAEIPAFLNIAEIDFKNTVEKISSKIPNRILKLEGYIYKEHWKEQLEIIIFKVFVALQQIQLK